MVQIVQLPCHCTHPEIPALGLPVERTVDLDAEHVRNGNLLRVQLNLYYQLWGGTPNKGGHANDTLCRQAYAGVPFPFPLFVFTNLCDVPLTPATLPSLLLGDPDFGLSTTTTALVVGPRWKPGFCAPPGAIPNPAFQGYRMSDKTEAVGRLYVCESVDNSIEALLRRKNREQPQEVHIYFVPNNCGCKKPFVCTWDNGCGIGTMHDMVKCFTYAQNAGITRDILNDGSEFGWVNGNLRRFGVGHQKAAYQRGSTLTVISRGENSDNVLESTKDQDMSLQTYQYEDQAKSWELAREERKVIDGESHQATSHRRGQAWEFAEPMMRRIVHQASVNDSYFIEIVSGLSERTLQQISILPTEIYKELAHMYFFYTTLPTFSRPPFNLGYPYGPIKMHLHVAKSGGVFEEFRLDQGPWDGWPDEPSVESPQQKELLSRECVPARLLRLVKANSTFESPPLTLPSGREVTDCFCFGFTHPKMQDTSGASPIHLVKLHYLPHDGCNELKSLLGLEGYGPVKAHSKTRLADVYYQGRLVPFAQPIEEIEVVTVAVKKALDARHASTQARKADRVKGLIQSRVFGQVFLQGAGAVTLVDETKFDSGDLNISVLLKEGDLPLFSVSINDQHKQEFQELSQVSRGNSLINDLAHWFQSCQDAFDREYQVGQQLPGSEVSPPSILSKCPGDKTLFALLTRANGGSTEPTVLKRGDIRQAKISKPPLYIGDARAKTPVDVLAFRLTGSHGSTGSRASVLLQLLPKECFGQKVFECNVDEFLKQMEETKEPARQIADLASLRDMELQVWVPEHEWKPADPLVLQCGSQAQEVKLKALVKNKVVTRWLKPDFEHFDKSRRFGIPTYQSHPSFTMTQTISLSGSREADSSGVVDTVKDGSLQNDEFCFSIPAGCLKAPQKLTASYQLKHCGRLFSEARRHVDVQAGPPACLHALSSPACKLHGDFSFDVECLDACGNCVLLPGDRIRAEDAEGLGVEVLSASLLEERHLLRAKARLVGSPSSLARKFGRDPDAPKAVRHSIPMKMKMDHRDGTLSGALTLVIEPGSPAKLVLAEGSSRDAKAENGGRLPKLSFVLEDASGCAVNLDGQEQWCTQVHVQGPSSMTWEEPCSIHGCHITTPDVLVDVGHLATEHMLQLVCLAKQNGVELRSSTCPIRLLPSNKPHMIVLQLGGSRLEPMTHSQFTERSRSAKGDIREAARGEASKVHNSSPPAFLLEYPNPQDKECPVDQLTLRLYSDLGPWDDDNQVSLHVCPSNRRKFSVDDGKVSGFRAPALEAPAHFYWVNCYKPNVAACCSFYLIVAAIEPPPKAWQCHAKAAAAGGRRGTRQTPAASTSLTAVGTQPFGREIYEATAEVQQPLSKMLCVCPVAEGGIVVRATGIAPSVRLEQALAEVRLVSGSGHSEEASGQLPWGEDLYLLGQAGTRCHLLFEGGGLLPARLALTLVPGRPVTFALYGLPQGPPASGVQEQEAEQQERDVSRSQWSCHQDLSGLSVVLRDASGNATTAPEQAANMQISSSQGASPVVFHPSSNLQLVSTTGIEGSSSQRFVLAQPDACRAHACPQVADLQAKLFLGEDSLLRRLEVTVQANGEFVGILRVQPIRSMAAGQALGGPLARVQLANDLGQEIISTQELQQMCRGLRADFEGSSLTCSVEGQELHVKLSRAPTKAARYLLRMSYEEPREAQASALLGSPDPVLQADPVHITVKAAEPAKLRVTSRDPSGDVLVASGRNDPVLRELHLQLLDPHDNPAKPHKQSKTITLTVSSAKDSPVVSLPTFVDSSVQVDERGRACFCNICFENRPALAPDVDTATLSLHATYGNMERAHLMQIMYYDSVRKSEKEAQQTQTTQKQSQRQHIRQQLDQLQVSGGQVLQRMEGSLNRAKSTPGSSVGRARDAVRSAVQQRLQLQQAAASAHQAVNALQHEGQSRAQGSAQTAHLRHILEAFRSQEAPSRRQFVLGLVLDLLTCKAFPGGDLHRLISWRLGPSVLHTVVVNDLETQARLSSFAMQRHTVLDIRVLSWLNKDTELPQLQSPHQDRLDDGYKLPDYLQSTCFIADTVPAQSRNRLLASLLGHTVLQISIEKAKEYREREIREQRNCPELLSLDGSCITEAGDILSASCPPQASGGSLLLGTSAPPALSKLHTKLQRRAGRLQGLLDEHSRLTEEHSQLYSSLSPSSSDQEGSTSSAHGETSRAADVRQNIEQAASSPWPSSRQGQATEERASKRPRR